MPLPSGRGPPSRIIVYALIVWRTWSAVQRTLPRPVLVFAAAAAFPPFFQTVIYGQVTLLILAPCFLAWRALERQTTCRRRICPRVPGNETAVRAGIRGDGADAPRLADAVGRIGRRRLATVCVWIVPGAEVFGATCCAPDGVRTCRCPGSQAVPESLGARADASAARLAGSRRVAAGVVQEWCSGRRPAPGAATRRSTAGSAWRCSRRCWSTRI